MPGSDTASDRRQTALIGAAAVAHAVLFVLAFPGADLWPLAFVAAAPLAWLAMASRGSTRRVLIVVFAVQLCMWLWAMRWVFDVTMAGYLLLCAYLSGYAVAFVWITRGIGRTFGWPAAFLAPVVWVGLECARGQLVGNGFPWFLAAYPAVEWPLLVQSADLLGTYFVSFLVVMVGGLLADVCRARSRQLSRRALLVATAATVALHGANLFYGAVRIDPGDAGGDGPVVLAIQTNLPQDNKVGWTQQQQVQDVAGFVELTLAAAAAVAVTPDLVVWPETMLPGFGLEPGAIDASVAHGLVEPAVFARTIARLAGDLGVPVLVGSPSFIGMGVRQMQWTWDAHYNSAYLVTGSPPYPRYDKSFLTPFGETMPYISAWPWLERQLLAFGAGGMRFDLDSNPCVTRFEVPWSGGTAVLATPICFEVTMGRVCRRMVYQDGVKRVDALVNLSNDGWFGSNDAGRRQHVQAARFRCVENRVPMIRSVNTGMSVAVDSSGRLIGPLAVTGDGFAARPRTPGWLLAELPLDRRSTVYGRIGDVWGWACLVSTAVLWIAAAMVRRRESGTGSPMTT
ncbi:MAG: apolipoprotein N-acyltransferase [Planctomycetes bacterium]|nr:apolipoprotein N-acyltransferase [Planctomycetota bacterium]